MTAAGEGQVGVVRLLLQRNCNTDLKDIQGWKASDHAVINGHHSIANIIDEHDEQHAKAKQRGAAGGGKSAPKKGQDFSNLLGASTAADEVEFSFGAPAVDMGAESTSAKEEDSVSQ